MNLSDYLEKKINDHIFGGPDYIRPSTIYVGLFTSAPSDGGGGTEISGNGYARLAITNNTTNFPGATSGTGTKTNGVQLSFAAASGGNWGTVTHYALFDAASSGNMLMHGELGTSRAVNDGDTIRIAAGALSITFG